MPPKDINQEIEDMANSLEKASTDPREKLVKAILALGPGGLKAKLPELNEEDRQVLKAALEEMTLQKAVSFDKEYAAKVINGKITDTIIQEEIGSDDADEKLVKPEAAHHNHQGGPVDGWEGQVIKSVNESDELTEKVVEALLQKGMPEDQVVSKCMAKGMDGKKVQGAVDKFKGKGKKMETGKEEMEKAEKMKRDEAKEKIMQMEEKEHGTKNPKKLVEDEKKEHAMKKAEKEESDKKDDGNKEAKKMAAKEEKQMMKKSVSWDDDSRLLKANTQGRNFHFDVDEFIQSNQTEPVVEPIKKSEGKEDINELIEKSQDTTWNAINHDKMMKSNAEKQNGQLIKSFNETTDLAEILGLTPEEAKKILG